MKRVRIDGKLALLALTALLMISTFAAADQKTAATPKPVAAAAKTATAGLAKVWLSESSHKEFRVDVSHDVFHAEWINVPAASAKQGAFIRTECRKSGDKWVGTSKISMLFGIPGAPAGKDTKLCTLSVRFEVDSISPDKISGHSESLHGFDVNTCRVQQTAWVPFEWVPKK